MENNRLFTVIIAGLPVIDYHYELHRKFTVNDENRMLKLVLQIWTFYEHGSGSDFSKYPSPYPVAPKYFLS